MGTSLTELEGCVLGLVWEMETCTSYAIRKVFQSSPNPHWSGSSGAIYPLVRRLAAAELLEATEDFAGEKRRLLYGITPKGRQTLRSWLRPPVTEESVGIPVDPLRVRLRFLAVLGPKERREFLSQAEQHLVAQVEAATAEYRSFDRKTSPFPYLVARGVATQARARLAWIREAIQLLD